MSEFESAEERALLDRIDAELMDSLETQPSLAFLPAVRRRVAELRAQRETARRRWLVPALATLAGVLVGGPLITDGMRGPSTAVSPRVAPAAPLARGEPMVARSRPPAPAPMKQAEPVRRQVPEGVPPPIRPEPAVAPSRPRVIVPAEDAQVVRRLALRLRGHAARAALLTPDVESDFSLALEPTEERRELLSFDHRVLEGAEPLLDEPPSFDRTVEKAGRKT